MSIDLLTVEVRHERRIRLLFTNAVGSGGLGTPAPSFYTVASQDGAGADPLVKAAMAVSGNPNAVELVLSLDLVRDGLYLVSAVGVPDTGAGVTGATSTQQIRWGQDYSQSDAEPLLADRARFLYGVDLIFNGEDYSEDTNGDLARVAGTANVTKALYHGIETTGLPWNAGWGAGAREFVDSPSVAATALRHSLHAQVLRDPRVRSIKTDLQIADAETTVFLTPTLITGETIEPVSLVVPNGA
jgi:hypothetical protein